MGAGCVVRAISGAMGRSFVQRPGVPRPRSEADTLSKAQVALFWSRIEPSRSGCWLWTGAPTDWGYGKIQFDYVAYTAHRLMYELVVGGIPLGYEVDHLCRVRLCVCPFHLEAVTKAENSRRAGLLGGLTTHCPRGHRYSAANVYLYRGRRYCRSCRRLSNREAARRRRTKR